MIYLLVTQTLTLLALAYVVRANQGTLRDVLTQSAADRKDHRAELAEILQRLQAPERAIAAHEAARDTDIPDGMPLTDEEIADRQQHSPAELQRMLDTIEQWEAEANEPVGIT